MGNFFITLINFIISCLGSLLSVVFSVLPNSPFQNLKNNSVVAKHLHGLAWVIPFPQIIAITELWVFAIASYYIYQVLLRWIKAIK